MSPVEKKARSPETELAADPGLIRAILACYRELELADLVAVLVEQLADWCGAEVGVGLGTTGERRGFHVMAAHPSADEPRAASVRRADPTRVKEWLAEGVRSWTGLGPFEQTLKKWPGSPPTRTVALPLLDSGEKWAGLILLFFEGEPSATGLARADRLLELVRPAISNALQVLSMRELVIKDDVANCFNRRHFEESLPEELSRASRFRSPLSLIFLDMDNLKQVNSAHGHAAGSRTLYEVSVRVRSRIRKFDKLFRFGGDEFCIVLPETEWHGAVEVAERVRDAVANRPFLERELGQGRGVAMTASLGVASYPLHAQTQKELIERADRAMQKVKGAMKNAVGIAEATGESDAE